MKHYALVALALILFSCGNKDAVTEKETQPVKDSLSIPSYMGFEPGSFKPLGLPLNIDTNFIQNADSSDRIMYPVIRSMAGSIVDHALFSSLAYDMHTVCKIDSLKEINRYQAYLDSLDIGMAKTAIAFRIGVIQLEQGHLFLWGISQQSYEACPFFSGTIILATHVSPAKNVTHALIGSISSGGDPPSMFGEIITSVIDKNGWIHLEAIQVNSDLDAQTEETTKQSLVLQLKAGKLVVSQAKKEKKAGKLSN